MEAVGFIRAWPAAVPIGGEHPTVSAELESSHHKRRRVEQREGAPPETLQPEGGLSRLATAISGSSQDYHVVSAHNAGIERPTFSHSAAEASRCQPSVDVATTLSAPCFSAEAGLVAASSFDSIPTAASAAAMLADEAVDPVTASLMSGSASLAAAAGGEPLKTTRKPQRIVPPVPERKGVSDAAAGGVLGQTGVPDGTFRSRRSTAVIVPHDALARDGRTWILPPGAVWTSAGIVILTSDAVAACVRSRPGLDPTRLVADARSLIASHAHMHRQLQAAELQSLQRQQAQLVRAQQAEQLAALTQWQAQQQAQLQAQLSGTPIPSASASASVPASDAPSLPHHPTGTDAHISDAAAPGVGESRGVANATAEPAEPQMQMQIQQAQLPQMPQMQTAPQLDAVTGPLGPGLAPMSMSMGMGPMIAAPMGGAGALMPAAAAAAAADGSVPAMPSIAAGYAAPGYAPQGYALGPVLDANHSMGMGMGMGAMGMGLGMGMGMMYGMPLGMGMGMGMGMGGTDSASAGMPLALGHAPHPGGYGYGYSHAQLADHADGYKAHGHYGHYERDHDDGGDDGYDGDAGYDRDRGHDGGRYGAGAGAGAARSRHTLSSGASGDGHRNSSGSGRGSYAASDAEAAAAAEQRRGQRRFDAGYSYVGPRSNPYARPFLRRTAAAPQEGPTHDHEHHYAPPPPLPPPTLSMAMPSSRAHPGRHSDAHPHGQGQGQGHGHGHSRHDHHHEHRRDGRDRTREHQRLQAAGRLASGAADSSRHKEQAHSPESSSAAAAAAAAVAGAGAGGSGERSTGGLLDGIALAASELLRAEHSRNNFADAGADADADADPAGTRSRRADGAAETYRRRHRPAATGSGARSDGDSSDSGSDSDSFSEGEGVRRRGSLDQQALDSSGGLLSGSGLPAASSSEETDGSGSAHDASSA